MIQQSLFSKSFDVVIRTAEDFYYYGGLSSKSVLIDGEFTVDVKSIGGTIMGEVLVFSPRTKISFVNAEMGTIFGDFEQVVYLTKNPIQVNGVGTGNWFTIFTECKNVYGVIIENLTPNSNHFVGWARCDNLCNCSRINNSNGSVYFEECSSLSNCTGSFMRCSQVSLSCWGSFSESDTVIPEGLNVTCKGTFDYN